MGGEAVGAAQHEASVACVETLQLESAVQDVEVLAADEHMLVERSGRNLSRVRADVERQRLRRAID